MYDDGLLSATLRFPNGQRESHRMRILPMVGDKLAIGGGRLVRVTERTFVPQGDWHRLHGYVLDVVYVLDVE